MSAAWRLGAPCLFGAQQSGKQAQRWCISFLPAAFREMAELARQLHVLNRGQGRPQGDGARLDHNPKDKDVYMLMQVMKHADVFFVAGPFQDTSAFLEVLLPNAAVLRGRPFSQAHGDSDEKIQTGHDW
ncbi:MULTISPECIES: hypothetical protein [Comamonas]|uniref:Uncharacterized protein n=1 Tax=Comamonas thiooxydans TaxID=363952 RepID=A0A0E3C2K2_9BURK|nr:MULTISPECIES: hypothetical protein [Comamonas]KGH13105.1 hypothetical protein P608_09245 [Comamonas thiooxydans]KGH22259.1 hypothetical protein P607_07675 [Comamonas thiooxydans]KGH22837.1 hypothetical protein P606_13820 [Comamonas thiooxydans]TZG12163.1 hypothetical protein FZC30_00595 [Comamonas thiooxydans]UNV90414.1 hypothetical protein MP576_23240 [Comamonas sp. 7D-2evo1]